jgi:hypothetical protein
MTNAYLSGLRTALVAMAVLAVAVVPLSGALAEQPLAGPSSTSGVSFRDSSETPDQQADLNRPNRGKQYARSGYVWPYEFGPRYGVSDPAEPGVLVTTSGQFQLRGPLAIPQALRTDVKLKSISAQVFAIAFDPEQPEDDLARLIASQGGRVLESPSAGILVAMLNGRAYDAVRGAGGVLAVEPYHPAFKLDPTIGRTPLPDPLKAVSDVYELEILTWAGEDAARVAEAVTELGGYVKAAANDVIVADVHRNFLDRVAGLEPVRAVFERLPLHPHSEETTTTIQTGQYNGGEIPYIDAGVDGGGGGVHQAQVLMVLDSGIQLDAGDLSDTRASAGSAGSAHRKVRVHQSASQWSATGGQGDLLGCDAPAQGGFTHGHVVAATALGNATENLPGGYGTQWNATDQFGNLWKLDGVAPHALLIAYDAQITPPNASCADPLLDGIFPGDIYNASGVGVARGSLKMSHDDPLPGGGTGARVANFSWGSNANVYSSNAQDVDLFLRDVKDSLVLISAGNNSVDEDANGFPDPETLGTPGNTKNGLSIGASRNANVGTGPESRAAFSSVGPAVNTTVNRIAPQLMAPGD